MQLETCSRPLACRSACFLRAS